MCSKAMEAVGRSVLLHSFLNNTGRTNISCHEDQKFSFFRFLLLFPHSHSLPSAPILSHVSRSRTHLFTLILYGSTSLFTISRTTITDNNHAPPPHTASMNVGIIAIFTVTEIHDYDIRKRMTGTLEKSEYLSSKGRWCIEINDKSVPDSSKGITFGSSNHCGVRLPKHGSISNCHFSLNFDKENRLVIIDHSTNGIEVKYGEQGAGLRDQSQCILNDPKLPPKLRQITIEVAGVMSFAVDVRLMLSSEESYTKFVKGFRDHCDKKSQDLAGGIQRATLHQTRHTTNPDQVSDIWLRWEVPKKGTLASITRCWNTENGTERIVKAPSSKYDEAKWSRQVEFLTILKDVRPISGRTSSY